VQGRRNLLIIAVRALAALIAVSLVWVALAEFYNEFLVGVSAPISPNGTETRVFDSDIVFLQTGLSSSVTVRGLTPHWRLVLNTTLVLSVSGITLLARSASLPGLGALVIFTHVLAVGLLPHGYLWVADPGSPICRDTGRRAVRCLLGARSGDDRRCLSAAVLAAQSQGNAKVPADPRGPNRDFK